MNKENLTDNDQLYRELMEQLSPAEREYGEIVGSTSRVRHLALAASVVGLVLILTLWGWERRNAEDVCVVRQEGKEVVSSSTQACQLMERQMAEMLNP